MRYPKFLPRIVFRSLPALFALGLSAVGVRADSIYLIGNSVTDTINYDGSVALAVSRGKTQPTARHMIPGAPLSFLWDNPAGGFVTSPYGFPTNALPNYQWDVLSLQPFDRRLNEDVVASKNFLGLLFGGATPTAQQLFNRDNSRIFIFGRWPRQDASSRPGGPRSYETLWQRSYTGGFDGTNETADYFATLTTSLRAETVSGVALTNRVFMVPVGHVLYNLDQQMRAGQIPGYSDIFQIYADGIHLNNIGSYITAVTYFATIYQESPVGLPIASQYLPAANKPTDRPLTPELAALIQEVVWDTVRAEPLSGVLSAANLTLATSAVPTARVGVAYTTPLLANGGVLPRSFAVTDGALPTGVSLSSAGVFSGAPSVAGTSDFTVTVSDAANPVATVSRIYRIVVEADSVPSINTAAALPAGNRISRYTQALTAVGGNGTRTWSLVSGALPDGLQLAANGALIGIPMAEGSFSFTARVADADTPADTAQRAFTLTIGAPAAETMFVARTQSPIRIDGSITETHWSLSHTAERTGLGTPDNTVRFQTLWDDQALYVAIRVRDFTLTPGVGTGVDRDSVEIYLDAFNDKEAEYNLQHRQLRIGADGVVFERGGRSSGITAATVTTPDGYDIECRIPWVNLGITPTADTTVIGFDVGVNDRDESATRQHFQRFAFADAQQSSPAQFGQALLTSAVVSGTGGEPLSVENPPLAYEGFNYATGALHGLNGGTGWAGGWQVQNSPTQQPGYGIATTAPLSPNTIPNSGAYATGGLAFQTSGRMLNVGSSSPLAALLTTSGGQSYLGGAGRTVWLSALMRRDTSSNDPVTFGLTGSNIAHSTNSDPRVEFGFLGSAGVVGGQRRYGFRYTTPSSGNVVVNSGVAVVTGQAAQLAVRVDFGGNGLPGRVRLYVNPPASETPPAAPTLDVTDLSPAFLWRALNFYPGSNTGLSSADEIRIGTEWSQVVTVGIPAVAPVTFSPAPGRFVTATNVTLSTATPGAVIHYTLDGTVPSAASPVYTAPLNLSATTIVRAIAILPAGSVSPVSGATFYRASTPFAAWWQQQSLPGTPDPVATAVDGTAYLVKFALGATSPSDPAAVPDVVLDEATSRLSLAFRRAREDFTYTVEGSNDLVAWTALAINPGQVGQDIVVEDPIAPIPPRRFIRLRVSPDPSG